MKTQNLNSKANIKQYTGADLPFASKQPVIAKGNIDSTLNQTVVNLPFTVDTINAQDSFFLIVDGKVLTIGASNDYTMTSIDALGFSNQATLTAAIPAGLNIQYYKLGLKKESEFAQDQRFVNVYEALGQGFQGFVSQSTLMTPTTATGTPAAGTFHSTVTNRKSIPDMRADLRSRMGIDRIAVQASALVPDEFGPNGETVFRAANDTSDSMRFIGNWSSLAGVAGQYILNNLSSGSYVEVTFFGTGLNLLANAYGAVQSYLISVDGNSETALVTPTYSGILDNRNYNSNQILNVANSLTLGVHTVRIKANSASFNMAVTGFEILNESTNVVTTAGTGYIQGKKAVATQNTISFTDSVTGTRGGRVVTYLNQNGTIGRAFRATNPSQGNLALADHTNEEVARKYNFREFGAGRTDDFSVNHTTGAVARAFTLDDGTTNLVIASPNGVVLNQYIGIDGATSQILFTFVGTGLDIIRSPQTGTTGAISLSVDNTNLGSLSTAAIGNQRQTIVSGLPYGTHTVNFATSSGGGVYFGISDFIVYQPKKPVLPSGVIELSDYNVMADYVVDSTAGVEKISQGLLRKIATRELLYINGTGGTTDWIVGGIVPASQIGGFQPISDRTNAYFEYTFFGTGFELRFQSAGSRSSNMPVTIDGLAATVANFPSLVSSVRPGTTFASGLLSPNVSTTSGSGVSIRGLSLGLHKVRVTNPSANGILIEAIDIITPIHSHKSNVNYAVRNTLTIGSQGISDNRALTPVKDLNVQAKNISQALPISAAPTTTSTSYVPFPDMQLTHISKTGRIKVSYSLCVQNSTIGAGTLTVPMINGIGPTAEFGAISSTVGAFYTISVSLIFDVPVGANYVGIAWRVVSGTASVPSGAQSRVLIVEDI